MTVNGTKPLRVDRSATTGRCHSAAAQWGAGNVQSRWVPGDGQIRKKESEIYDYEAKQSYAGVVKVVDGNSGSDSTHVTLELLDFVDAPVPVPARRFGSAARRLTSFASPLSAVLLLALAALLAAPMPIQAAGNAQLEPCSGGGFNPTPTVVAVDAVPIVVESTTDEYFVLYVSHEVDADTTVDIPVLVKRGEAGTTTLGENVEAQPAERYRVEKYLVADPADVDGDCVDDITELNDLGAMNPVNPAADVPLNDGAVAVPDTHTYDALAIGGYFKFALLGMDTDRPSVYFINANTHPTHQTFLDDRHINRQRVILGTIAYRQNRVAPDGSQGVYLYSLNTLPSRYSFSFSLMGRTHTLLAASNEEIALLAAGITLEELRVENVVLRIQANPTEPHGAVADFVLIRTRQEREVSREAWTATMQFVFMPVIPADLVIFNPMGIQVTYLETDRTLITETP